jgi:hypothetical protein
MSITGNDLRNIISGFATAEALMLDAKYEPVSRDAVEKMSGAWLNTIPMECVIYEDVGGGKRIRRPLWIPEAGDCDRHAFSFYSHVQTGEWLAAVKTKDGRGGAAFGTLCYVAEPRTENRFRDGRHCINWLLEPDGTTISFWEPGDSGWTTLTPSEKESIYFVLV